MGKQRLTVAWACALAACSHHAGAPAPAAATPGSRAPAARVRHAQIVRAAQTSERLALVERFRAKNGSGWRVLRLDQDVEPFRLFLRRAARPEENDASPDVALDADDAARDAVAFVAANADALGLASSDLPILEVSKAALAEGTGPTERARFAIRLRARVPMRGYEAFASLASEIDVSVFVDGDRRIRLFTNASRIHPRLAIDTTPVLGPDDARLLAHVLGREMFVAVGDARDPRLRVRELRRLSVGRVEESDVVRRTLTIWASSGPRAAYVSYVLAYVVHVVREGVPFRFVVDADTGDLVDDAAVPVVSRGAGDGSDEL